MGLLAVELAAEKIWEIESLVPQAGKSTLADVREMMDTFQQLASRD